MARARDFAVTPKGILNGLRRVAPYLSVDVTWEPDYGEVWDGDGPDPREEGMVAHTVRVAVEIEDDEGEKFEGDDYLGGVWGVPGEEDPDVHGYFPGMLQQALQELYKNLTGKTAPKTSRKFWDPRGEGPGSEEADQVAEAIKFATRSMHEIYERQRRRFR